MPGPIELPKRRALQSWKEIAAFLGVTVRSVQRWESAGLPVYRQGEGARARVFAYEDELQAWLEASAPSRPPERPADRPRHTRWVVYPATIALLAASAGLLSSHWRSMGLVRKPSSARLDGTRLTVVDSRDRLCWEKSVPGIAPRYETGIHDRTLVADIDADTRPEILVNAFHQQSGVPKSSLLCFEQDGRLRWEHFYGGVQTFGERTFEPAYSGRFVRPVTVEGRQALLTVANHFRWYPSRVALLDPATGRVLEDYWHPGAIHFIIVSDLDHDGADEVVFAGINNPGTGLGHSSVGILNLPFQRPPKDSHIPAPRFPVATGGGERAYALLPLPDVCRVMGTLPIPAELSIDHRGRIVVQTPLPEGGGLVYYLDSRLDVQEYRASDNLASLHFRYRKQHLLDHDLTSEEVAEIGRPVRFIGAPDGNAEAVARLWKF